MATGTASSSADNPARRSEAVLALLGARAFPGRRAEEQQHHERGHEQHHRHRGAPPGCRSPLREDEHRGRLGLERRLPVMSTSEPNSPTARAKASPPPAMIAGARFGRMMRRNTVARLAPSDSAACSISRSSSSSTGWTARTTKGKRHEQQGHDHGHPGEGDVDAHRAVGPVEGQQRQPGDDRGQRERQVDERVDHALAGKLVAHEHPGDQRSEQGVDQHHDHRGDQGQPQRRHGLRAADGVPERVPAAVERLEHHRRQRDQRDDAEVGHGDAAAEHVPRNQGRPRAAAHRCCGRRGAGAAVAELVGGSALPLRLEDVSHDAALRVEELVVDLAPAAELA